MPCINELAKSNSKDKKKKWLKKKKNSTWVIENNTIEDKKKWAPSNTSQVTCYNCQKKAILQTNTQNQKTSIGLDNFCTND